ncbi:MAG: tRNA dimethylallyltransferase [Lysobacterales bacterium]|jgi:tRNA dimethylallyltransferase
MGPTASGKTGLAVELVKRFPLEIISVDSALVYRGMDIGTAKPDTLTLQEAPHRLINICDPQNAYSAAQFCADAKVEIKDIQRSGRMPLLVGGTMLYFHALLQGLSDLPAADPEVRLELEREAAKLGWKAMHQQLQTLDPVAAGRINPNDPQRIQRALEVIRISGEPISKLQSVELNKSNNYNALKLIVSPDDRQILHQRIEQRFHMMIDQGFVSELRELHARADLSRNLPSMRAVGYRQGWDWLEGDLADDEWIEKAIIATRQLAKRQLTWLRREKQAVWYDLDKEESYESVFQTVREFYNRLS